MKRPMERNATAILRKAACGDDRKPRHLPCKQSFQGSARGRVGSLLTGAAILLLSAAGAHAQFGPQPVGTSTGNQGVTVTASVAGTVSSVQILTMGSPSGDFAAGTGASNCAPATPAQGATCTESVRFTPSTPGMRMGAVVLVGTPTGGSGQSVLGTAYLSGTGTGGLGVLVAGNLLPVAGQARPLHIGWRRPAGHSGSTLLA